MNSRHPSIVLLVTLVLASAMGTAGAAPADRAARAKEFTALRLKYAASDAYNPYDGVVSDLRVQCAEQMLNKDYAKAIELAERGLQRNPYNIQLLMVQAAAYRASGDTARADEIRNFWYGVMDSIIDSGDGLGYRTAFQVISVDEEDAVLQALQLTSTDKRSVERKGSQFDIVSAENRKTGENREIYFNVDLPKQWQARQIARREAAAKPGAQP